MTTPVANRFMLAARTANRGVLNRFKCFGQNENRRICKSISSQRRRYATTFDMPEYVGHVNSQVSFTQDYDDWNSLSSKTNATNCDLGQLYHGEGVESVLCATTPMGNSIQMEEQSSFSVTSDADDYYINLEKNFRIIDGTIDTGDDKAKQC